MACVARGHGGDAGGDPPGGPWKPPTKCQTSKVRGKTTGKKLRDAFKKNGERPFPIVFDVVDQETIRPVGTNGSMFTGEIGLRVRQIRPYYNSWEDVPVDKKSHIWSALHHYFILEPHLNGPHSEIITRGINKIAGDRYSDHKYHFKKDHFVDRQGQEHPEEIRNYPPVNMPFDEWNKYVDFITSEKFVHQSKVNTENKAKQQYPSLHGSCSYAGYRYKHYESEQEFPSLINQFGHMHSRNGTYVNDVARAQHEEMIHLKRTEPGRSEQEILKQVLGERRGHNRGRGRKISGVASTSNTQPPEKTYTQQEVDEMMANTQQLLAAQSQELATQSQRLDLQASQQAAIFNALRAAKLHIPDYPGISGTHQNEDDEESD